VSRIGRAESNEALDPDDDTNDETNEESMR
jgi:hypothetical protein